MPPEIFGKSKGSVLLEFLLFIVFFIPLIYLLYVFGSYFLKQYNTMNVAHIVTWDWAYGNQNEAENNKFNEMLRDNTTVSTTTTTTVSKSNTNYVMEFGLNVGTFGFSSISSRLGLNTDTRIVTVVDNTYRIPVFQFLPTDITTIHIREKSCLEYDPWNLTDLNNDNKIDNDDLERQVYKLWMWPFNLPAIETALNVIQKATNAVGKFIKAITFGTQDFDFEIRGRPNLGAVPDGSFIGMPTVIDLAMEHVGASASRLEGSYDAKMRKIEGTLRKQILPGYDKIINNAGYINKSNEIAGDGTNQRSYMQALASRDGSDVEKIANHNGSSLGEIASRDGSGLEKIAIYDASALNKNSTQNVSALSKAANQDVSALSKAANQDESGLSKVAISR